MDNSLFKQLVESMSQMGEITRGERPPARIQHVLKENAAPDEAIQPTTSQPPGAATSQPASTDSLEVQSSLTRAKSSKASG